ncbi:MAG: branched-chain amino acid ABC transporter permease, partial [Nitrospirae bacterium]|nr:branched-chain amino acid ABC transporter permease [Nitrospirota bacterium]
VRFILIALWFSILFLPFKGIKAAAILFIALSIIILFTNSLLKHLKKAKIPAIPLTRHSSLVTRHLLVLLLFALPLITTEYFIDVAILAGIYIILALGLNVVVGFTGLLNLGFVAFYAIGAYTYALLNTKFGLGFWSALPFSIGLTTVAGFLLAIPALRLRGDYLAIVTLGFGEIVRLILNNWDSVTRGPNGISGIAPPVIMSISFAKLSYYYYLVLLFAILAVFITRRVYSSRIGRAWVAIREDEIASSAMGINTTIYKLYAFAFGAFWAGLAGVIFAGKMQFVSPESFTFMESVLILSMVILGGLGSIPGVILGAIILVLLPEILREVQLYRMLALGSGLVLLMIFRPQGLLGGKGVSLRS